MVRSRGPVGVSKRPVSVLSARYDTVLGPSTKAILPIHRNL